MDDQELRKLIADLDKKISDVYISAEKTRKYFLTVIIVSVIAFVLPMLGLVFAVPSMLSMYSSFGNF